MKSKLITVAIITLSISLNAFAQYPEDALRLGQSEYGVSARSMSMGNAMTGLSEGYDATFFNPAGLAQSRQSEVSMGLNFLGYNNDATYFGTPTSSSSSQTDVSNAGLVYPFPTTKGSFVIAFGYNRAADFNSALGFNGFNSYSSIIPTLFDANANYDVPFQVGLDDEYYDTVANKVNITRMVIQKNVQQSGIEYETGGINNWTGTAALDIAKDFSVGLTLGFVTGSYGYKRTFKETDPTGRFSQDTLSTLPGAVGFQSFSYSFTDNQDLSGWTAKTGFLYRLVDSEGNTFARFGFAITFPTSTSVTDKFADAATAVFLTGTTYSYPQPSFDNSTSDNYDVTTPFKFSAGVSGGTEQILFSAEVEYVDWSQLEFSNASNSYLTTVLDNLNTQIKGEFKATTTFRAGLELALTNPRYSLFIPFLRVGGQYLPSPYVNQTSSQAQKFISGGVGFKLQNSIDLDFAYQYGWWNTTHQLYDSYSTTSEKITNTNFMFTFAYNF